MKEYNILLHSNSNKLTDGYSSLHQAQEAMKKMYETTKLKCNKIKPSELTDNDNEDDKEQKEDKMEDKTNSDIGSLSSDCSIPKQPMTKSPVSPSSSSAFQFNNNNNNINPKIMINENLSIVSK